MGIEWISGGDGGIESSGLRACACVRGCSGLAVGRRNGGRSFNASELSDDRHARLLLANVLAAYSGAPLVLIWNRSRRRALAGIRSRFWLSTGNYPLPMGIAVSCSASVELSSSHFLRNHRPKPTVVTPLFVAAAWMSFPPTQTLSSNSAQWSWADPRRIWEQQDYV